MYILGYSVSPMYQQKGNRKCNIPEASTQVLMNHGSAKAESWGRKSVCNSRTVEEELTLMMTV
jgi:hypothetical protein